jgi:hypothetical protein
MHHSPKNTRPMSNACAFSLKSTSANVCNCSGANALNEPFRTNKGAREKRTLKSPHRACHEHDERRDHGDAPVHRLEQPKEENRPHDMEGDTREREHSGEPIQGLMRQDVGGCRCGVAGNDESARDDHLPEDGRPAAEEITDPGQSCVDLWRSFNGANFHPCSSSVEIACTSRDVTRKR